jgi:nifR3 family TIM-barrel protein
MSFWQQFTKPIIGLSPMDGVTDHPFRHIVKKYGQPDLIYTEFTSVEGVCHGATQLLEDFLFDESQRPAIAQIYGTTPQFFRETAVILCELGFDGIDINMGCPAKNVAHSGAGAALIRTPELAQEIVRQTKAGVQDYLNGMRAKDCPHIVKSIAAEVERRHQLLSPPYQNLKEVPVSVKTRVGYDQKIAESWIATLLEVEPVAIALHGRTLKQQYSGFADWDEIGKAVAVAASTPTLILGNGDVKTKEDALQKVAIYGVDGVLMGKGSFGNPAIFKTEEELRTQPLPSIYQIAIEHSQLYQDTYSHREKYSFMPMRKHLGWYIKAIPAAAEIRQKLFRTDSVEDVQAVFAEYGLN